MRRSFPNPIGLSVIDLFSCAFTALFVLNLLSEKDKPAERQAKSGLDFISAEMGGVNRDAGFILGLTFKQNGTTYSSWEPSRRISWIATPGKIVATNLPKPLSSHTEITVVLIELPAGVLSASTTPSPSFLCYISSSRNAKPTSILLSADNGWRASTTTD